MATDGYQIQNFFPVYDLLHTQVKDSDDVSTPLNEDEIKKLIFNITTMDDKGKDLIYIWIRIHSLRYSNSKLLDIPYSGERLDMKQTDSELICDVKFDIRSFPIILNRMLIRFTDLHLRKIKEDMGRTKNNQTISIPETVNKKPIDPVVPKLVNKNIRKFTDANPPKKSSDMFEVLEVLPKTTTVSKEIKKKKYKNTRIF
jgi:hypothetical protein